MPQYRKTLPDDGEKSSYKRLRQLDSSTEDWDDSESLDAGSIKSDLRKHELREMIEKAHETKKEEENSLSELAAAWTTRRAKPLRKLQQTREERKALEHELGELLHPPVRYTERPPPGPKKLRFVDDDDFLIVASVVIVMNVITMLMEMFNKAKYGGKFFILNSCYLAFYVYELVTKALLHQTELLVGKCSIVWWNWLDLVIVVSGILDLWVMPLVNSGKKGGNSFMGLLRVLRLARLIRLAAVLRRALSDLSWTEGARFQLFIIGVITFNAVVMGLESDYPEFEGWFYIDEALLVIFTFELAARLHHWRWEYFRHKEDLLWNWLDFIIVVGGIMYSWVMPCILLVQHLLFGPGAAVPQGFGQIMTMLRMLRLIRILRLIRLVRTIPPLYTLIQGIIVAMQGMGWVVILTFVLLYALALVCVSLFGHGMAYGNNAPDDVAAVFPDIPTAIFALFDVMNGEIDLLEPIYDTIPVTRYVFMFYVIITTWSILSILTAVVSDNMIRASEEHAAEVQALEWESDLAESEKTLHELFDKADTNHDESMSEEELRELLQSEESKQRLLEAASLGHPSKKMMKEGDLQDLWNHLSQPMEGETVPVVTRQRFVTGLQEEGRPVTERSVMRLEKKIDEIEDVLLLMQRYHLEDSLKSGLT